MAQIRLLRSQGASNHPGDHRSTWTARRATVSDREILRFSLNPMPLWDVCDAPLDASVYSVRFQTRAIIARRSVIESGGSTARYY